VKIAQWITSPEKRELIGCGGVPYARALEADDVTARSRRLPLPSLSFSVESSEARRAVHGISHLYTPITHTLYSLIKRQTNFCVVFIDHRDTCASFLASSFWNKQLVQQQRVWGEYGVHSDLSDFVVWSSQVKV